jgi:hypothetical protein
MNDLIKPIVPHFLQSLCSHSIPMPVWRQFPYNPTSAPSTSPLTWDRSAVLLSVQVGGVHAFAVWVEQSASQALDVVQAELSHWALIILEKAKIQSFSY